jgi:hypothetical protein
MENKEFNWTDNNVIDFVNWYLKIHNIPDNYELENQEVLDSFKRNEQPEVWTSNLTEETSKTILPEYDRIDFEDSMLGKPDLNKCSSQSLITWLEEYHKALQSSEKELFELKCLNKKLFDDNIQLELILDKTVLDELKEYNELIDKYGEISWKIHELANMLHYEKILDGGFRQKVRRMIEEYKNNNS